MAVTGGKKLAAFLAKAKAAKTIKSVEVGFFSTARYSPVRQGKNGGQKRKPHYVATVAAWNEFGTRLGGKKHVPERPFMRSAIRDSVDPLRKVLREHVNPHTMNVDNRVGGLLGTVMKGQIQKSITSLKEPPNAPVTIKRKGSSNPLIDEGFMRQSVSWKVNA